MYITLKTVYRTRLHYFGRLIIPFYVARRYEASVSLQEQLLSYLELQEKLCADVPP